MTAAESSFDYHWRRVAWLPLRALGYVALALYWVTIALSVLVYFRPSLPAETQVYARATLSIVCLRWIANLGKDA